ncbi:hypothetical protein DFP73DRAFT_554369 [Morchella snyderi]|nr:hypothetical protein DFP73DRAFT_554369 [Morchella snyderi]
MKDAKVPFSSTLCLAIILTFLIMSTSGVAISPHSPDSEPGGANTPDLRDGTLAEVPRGIQADSSDNPPATGQVTPYNILWVLVTLNLSYITHPLNRSLWIPPCDQLHVQFSFYAPILDAALLLVEVFYHTHHNTAGGNTAVSGMVRLRRAIQSAAYDRLKASSTETTTALSLKAFLSSSRPLLSIITILQYVKLCGYSNIGSNYFAWATLLLVSWLVLETVYCIACCPKLSDFRNGSPNSLRKPADDAIWFLMVVNVQFGVLLVLTIILAMEVDKGFEGALGSVFTELMAAMLSVWTLSLTLCMGGVNGRGGDWGLLIITSVLTLTSQTLFYARFFYEHDLSLSEKARWTEILP